MRDVGGTAAHDARAHPTAHRALHRSPRCVLSGRPKHRCVSRKPTHDTPSLLARAQEKSAHILRFAACNCGMTHTYTQKGPRRYRYYVCNRAQQQGRKVCPCPSVSAPEIERFIVDEIRCIGRDPAIVAATVAEPRRQMVEAIKRLKQKRAALERERRNDAAEFSRVAGQGGDEPRRAEIQDRMYHSQRRLADIRSEVERVIGAVVPCSG
jgi:hypothetical protein